MHLHPLQKTHTPRGLSVASGTRRQLGPGLRRHHPRALHVPDRLQRLHLNHRRQHPPVEHRPLARRRGARGPHEVERPHRVPATEAHPRPHREGKLFDHRRHAAPATRGPRLGLGPLQVTAVEQHLRALATRASLQRRMLGAPEVLDGLRRSREGTIEVATRRVDEREVTQRHALPQREPVLRRHRQRGLQPRHGVVVATAPQRRDAEHRTLRRGVAQVARALVRREGAKALRLHEVVRRRGAGPRSTSPCEARLHPRIEGRVGEAALDRREHTVGRREVVGVVQMHRHPREGHGPGHPRVGRRTHRGRVGNPHAQLIPRAHPPEGRAVLSRRTKPVGAALGEQPHGLRRRLLAA